MKTILILALVISPSLFAECKYVDGKKFCTTEAYTNEGTVSTSCDSSGFCAQGMNGASKDTIRYYQDGKDVTNQVKNMKGYKAP